MSGYGFRHAGGDRLPAPPMTWGERLRLAVVFALFGALCLAGFLARVGAA